MISSDCLESVSYTHLDVYKRQGYPQTEPYKWWNWHDNYNAEASPNAKWVDVITDADGAAKRRNEEEKAS